MVCIGLHPQAALPFVGGSDAGPPLMGGWSLCICFPLMGMALQNHPHPCLVLVIHEHKMATRGEGGRPTSPGGLLPLREDGCSCVSFSLSGLHGKRAAHPLHGPRLMLLKAFGTTFQHRLLSVREVWASLLASPRLRLHGVQTLLGKCF